MNVQLQNKFNNKFEKIQFPSDTTDQQKLMPLGHIDIINQQRSGVIRDASFLLPGEDGYSTCPYVYLTDNGVTDGMTHSEAFSTFPGGVPKKSGFTNSRGITDGVSGPTMTDKRPVLIAALSFLVAAIVLMLVATFFASVLGTMLVYAMPVAVILALVALGLYISSRY